MKATRILFQPGTQLEMAMAEFRTEVKAVVGPDISRNQALRFFAELGCKHWYEQKIRFPTDQPKTETTTAQ